MNTDTMFPMLTKSEKVIGKYRHHSWGKGIEFIAILTDQRLHTRSKQTVCCCYHHLSYTAISLESIHRIDEHRTPSNTPLYSVLWIFWLLLAIAGILISVFIAKDDTIKIIGITVSSIPLVIICITIFTYLCCSVHRKSIELNGTFGSLKIVFEKQEARLFEAHLSEQIFQGKLRLQQTSVSPTSLPTYYLRNETVKMDQQTITSSRF
jgi:hypothetical protein